MDIFLSYNWNIKEQVKLLHNKLESLNFKVWRDDKQLHAGNNALTAELAKGIKKSKVVICCITKDYCKSNNCNLEIEFASSCKKQIIVLMIDKIEPTEIDEIQVEDRLKYSGIGFLILPLIRINCYKKITETNTYVMNPEWPHLKKDEILDAIKSCLEIVNTSNKLLQGMFNKRYKKIIEIGKGAQGIVYKVQDTQDNNKFKALKKFHQIPIELKESIKWIVAEIELLKNISNQSEYVINYLDTFNQTFMDPDDNEYIIYYVVNNLYEDGTLEDEIEGKRFINKRLEDHNILSWTLQLLKGTKFLHENKLIHRDLKPANIFLHRGTLVIGDLGHAKALDSNNSSNSSSNRSISNRAYGTNNYLAPEASNFSKYTTEKIDIWSLGCIIYELLKLEKLFYDFNQERLKESIKHFNVDTQLNTDKIDPEYPLYVRLLRNCLKQIPEHRLSAEQLIDFLNGKRSDLVAIVPPRILNDRTGIPSASTKPIQALTAEAAAAESSKLNIASVRPIESVPIKTNHDNKLKQFEIIGKEINKLEGHTNGVYCLAILPNNQLASGSSDHTIRIWDANKGKEIYKLEGHTSYVNCLVVLPNNQLVSGSADHTIRIWDVNKGKEIHKLIQNDSIWCLVVLPNNQLASGSFKEITIWDLNKGKEIYKLEGHTHSVWCLVLLPKNQLASGSRDNTIRIWDMNKGKEIYKLEGHTDCVWCLVALPNNQLASGSWDEKIVIWDLIKGKEIYKLEGHTNRLYSLVVLPNNQLVSGSADNTIRIWDLNKGKEIKKLQGHTDRVFCLVVLPNNQLASGSWDKTIRVWI